MISVKDKELTDVEFKELTDNIFRLKGRIRTLESNIAIIMDRVHAMMIILVFIAILMFL